MPHEPRQIAKQIHIFNALHRIRIQRAASECGLHLGQPPILEYVQAHEGCTQRELAQGMRVSAPSIATSVKRLQRAGMLQKLPDESDLRITRLSVTELGRKTARGCRLACDEIDRQVFEGFTRGELEQLGAFLDRLVENLTGGENICDLIEQEKGEKTV